MLLVSTGAMVVEIALTRVFSLALYYHFAFLVIGLAMLGLGAGGLLVWRQQCRGGPMSVLPARWAMLAGLASAGATALLVLVGALAGLPAYTALAALPFALVGATTAAVLARFPASSGRLYAADLGGAALGVSLSIPLLQVAGGVSALLAAAALMGWGGWLLGRREESARRTYLAAACFLSVVTVLNLFVALLDVNIGSIDTDKPMIQQLGENGRIVFTRWDAFARTDVVASPEDKGQMYLFIDGGAGAVMYRFNGDLSAPSPLRQDVGFFPFHERPAGEVLDIGPGGGRDVLMALMGGATRVTAVEVNPGTVEAVRRFADFNGGLYDRPEVEVVVDEGRSYLRRSSRLYDTIYLSLTMAQVAERSGYALTENYLYTVEAIRDYLDHLKPNGELVFKLHGRLDLERVIRTATRALVESGVPPDRVSWYMEAVVEADNHGHGDDLMFPVLVIRRDPYTAADVQRHLSAGQTLGFVPIYEPGVGGTGPLKTLDVSSLAGDQLPGVDLSPTTDDRPFFYLYQAGPPPLLLVVLAITIIVAILTWKQLRGTLPSGSVELPPSMAYFGCLGLAFMLVEVALIQKLTLFLGHPTVAVTTVLFALLVSGAGGSWVSGRAGGAARIMVAAPALAAALALAYSQIVPWSAAQFFAWQLPQRTLFAGVLVAPLGFFMGMPFPTGLRALARGSSVPLVTLAWAANGFTSVLGSTLAIVLATLLGFTASLVAGGVAYLGVALAAAVLRQTVANPPAKLPGGDSIKFSLPTAVGRSPL